MRLISNRCRPAACCLLSLRLCSIGAGPSTSGSREGAAQQQQCGVSYPYPGSLCVHANERRQQEFEFDSVFSGESSQVGQAGKVQRFCTSCFWLANRLCIPWVLVVVGCVKGLCCWEQGTAAQGVRTGSPCALPLRLVATSCRRRFLMRCGRSSGAHAAAAGEGSRHACSLCRAAAGPLLPMLDKSAGCLHPALTVTIHPTLLPPLIRLDRSCADGYNVCLLAYGQTGSGKTHTMMGPTENPGGWVGWVGCVCVGGGVLRVVRDGPSDRWRPPACPRMLPGAWR